MLDDWFHTCHIPMPEAGFKNLPRHPAYQYRYRQGEAIISPRPHVYHAMLPVSAHSCRTRLEFSNPHITLRLRTIEERDWPHLVPVFAASMASSIPVQTLLPEARMECARASIERTRSGEDGPIAFPACYVATGPDDVPQAAILVTLIFNGNMETYEDAGWDGIPPDNALEQRWGRPHLTWILVEPAVRRRGVGEALLACAVNRLHQLGYQELASSFLSGNNSSMLWHWKMGFRLLSHVLSPRRLLES